MELRKAAPKVGQVMAGLIAEVVADAYKNKGYDPDRLSRAARTLADHYSICLECKKIKKHSQFKSCNGVLLGSCMMCAPAPAAAPPKPKRPSQSHEEYQRKAKIKQLSYWEKNRDRMLVQGRNRRARLRGVPGTHTEAEWIALCERFDYRCVCCGERKPLECDHVIALARVDSTNDISNIQPLCESCNSKKGRDSIDFRQTPFTRSGIEIQSTLRTLRKSVPVATLDGW